jgi:hypothetical protein
MLSSVWNRTRSYGNSSTSANGKTANNNSSSSSTSTSPRYQIPQTKNYGSLVKNWYQSLSHPQQAVEKKVDVDKTLDIAAILRRYGDDRDAASFDDALADTDDDAWAATVPDERRTPTEALQVMAQLLVARIKWRYSPSPDFALIRSSSASSASRSSSASSGAAAFHNPFAHKVVTALDDDDDDDGFGDDFSNLDTSKLTVAPPSPLSDDMDGFSDDDMDGLEVRS